MSKCKQCKAKIDKDAPRLGVESVRDNYNAISWYHPQCYNPSKKKIEALCEVTEIRGLDMLPTEAQKVFIDVWENIKSGKRRAGTQSSGASNKRPKTIKEEMDVLEQENPILTEKYLKMKVPELKKVLHANKQLVGGTKDALVARCVDGEQYGAIPICPRYV